MKPDAWESKTRDAVTDGADSHVTLTSSPPSQSYVVPVTSRVSSRAVMTHIYVLYALVGVLSAALAATIWLTSCRLDSLQSALVSCMAADTKLQPLSGCHQALGGLDPHPEASGPDSGQDNMADLLRRLEAMRSSLKYEHHDAGQDLGSEARTKRDASSPGNVLGEAGDWVWMSSFSRIPLSALQGYCREAQLYCAAEGKQGPPGEPGSKGDTGNKGPPGPTGPPGEKGEAPDPDLVAQNLGSMEHIRGPPGQKGEPGEKGAAGERGNMGPTGPEGRPGVPGIDGMKGEPGPQGPPGDRGFNGANGEDGKRGPVGPVGQKGEKGDMGHCPSLCTDSRQPQATTSPTTPETTTATTTPTTTMTTTTATTTRTPAPTLPPRDTACSIQMIGKPYFKTSSSTQQGAWLRDLSPPSSQSDTRLWLTQGTRGTQLFEYDDEAALMKNDTRALYELDARMPYLGTGHVIVRNSLYYHWADTWKIVRYDLRMRAPVAVQQLHHRGAQLSGVERLYPDVEGVVDFAVDQTGLWVLYANVRTTPSDSDNDNSRKHPIKHQEDYDEDVVFLAKLDPESLNVLKKWTLRLPLSYRGNAVMVCGTLYVVRDAKRHRTSISFAFDAYTEEEKRVKIGFTNPYSHTAQLAYDPRRNEILGWDSGNLVLYPLLLTDRPL